MVPNRQNRRGVKHRRWRLSRVHRCDDGWRNLIELKAISYCRFEVHIFSDNTMQTDVESLFLEMTVRFGRGRALSNVAPGSMLR